MQLFQFIGALVGSAIVIATASIAWPLVTVSPMPTVLEDVRRVVIQTPLGQQASNVLGVSDPSQSKPVNVSEFVTNKASEVLMATKESLTKSATTTILTQLMTRYKELSEDQKQVVRASICVQESTIPTETTP